jgi:hypothetical protein
MIFQGWLMSAFQASQHWPTMSSKALEHSVGQPVLAHELPDIFLSVQLG